MRAFLFLVILSFVLLAQEKLKEEEIKNSPKVQFKNKTTKKAHLETKTLHENLGKKLGRLILAEPTKTHELEGIRVIRISTQEEEKLGGDILYLGASTNFGHIHSIQRILSGYLQTVFDYPESQAEILAIYTLYYNAIHRGKLNYILSKYTSKIKDFLTNKGMGISTNHREWAGNTEIVIPVEKNILKKFSKDVKLDELEENVSSKEIESKNFEEEKKKFEEFKKEKLNEEKKAIEEKKEEIVKLEEVLGDKYKQIDEKLKELKKEQDPNSKQVADLEKEKEILFKKKETLQAEKESIQEREKQISKFEKSKDLEQKTQTEEVQPSIADKTLEKNESSPKETQKDNLDNVALVPTKEKEQEVLKKEDKKTEIKDSQKLEIELKEVKKELEAKKEEERKKIEFSPNVLDGKIFFIKPVTYIEGQCNNELHALDPNKDDFVYKSEYNQICGRVFKEFGGHILVIGFKEHKDQIRLVLLSRVDLKPIAFSDTDVHQKTILEVQQDFLFAVEVENGKHYLAKYNRSLKRLVRTEQEIFPDANITFFGKKIYVSGKNEGGKVEFKIFNREDLKFIKKIQT